MQRKLVKQGQNALTVTVPAEWTKANGLSAGDEISLQILNEKIIVETASKPARKTISIKATDQKLLWQKLLTAYLEGYDEIHLGQLEGELLEDFLQYLPGLQLISRGKSCVIKSIQSQPTESFEELRTRIIFQFLTIAKEAVHKQTFTHIKGFEKILDANIFYTLRYLKKYANLQKDYKQFLFFATIETAADNISELAKYKPTKKQFLIIAQAVECFIKENDDEAFLKLQELRMNCDRKTFEDGLTYTVLETLYNYAGYLRS